MRYTWIHTHAHALRYDIIANTFHFFFSCVTHLNAFLHIFPYLCGIVFQPAGIVDYLSQLLLVIGQNFGIFR